MNKFDRFVSKRSIEIPPFLVMDVLERALDISASGDDVIHLEVGEPDFDTPANITEAGIMALRAGRTHYTSSTGIPELKTAISKNFEANYGVEVDPQRIIVTSGSSPAILLALAALLDHGDEIILSNPHYACYPNFVRFLGGTPVFINVYPEEGFQLSPHKVRQAITRRTKAIMINSPSNPTGTIIDPEHMRELADLEIPIISDEIYHGLVYEGKENTILEFTDKAFVINGFSKLFAMTGWRLGYVISLPEFVRPIQKMSQNFFISAADFVQYAGVEALTNSSDETSKMRQVFNQRRLLMLERLPKIGFEIRSAPVGAFYILADARQFSNDSYKFAFEILEDAKVGVAPGIDFGSNAEGFIRFSYTNSMEKIDEGLNRLERYIQKRFS